MQLRAAVAGAVGVVSAVDHRLSHEPRRLVHACVQKRERESLTERWPPRSPPKGALHLLVLVLVLPGQLRPQLRPRRRGALPRCPDARPPFLSSDGHDDLSTSKCTPLFLAVLKPAVGAETPRAASTGRRSCASRARRTRRLPKGWVSKRAKPFLGPKPARENTNLPP